MAAMGAILCSSLLLPALVAFGIDEVDFGFRILLYGALGGFISTSILLAVLGRSTGLARNASIQLAVTAWILFPLAFAIPIMELGGLSFLDAWFQTVSAFTTTGADLFAGRDDIPRSLIFMLAMFQWFGALATLITFTLVLAPWDIGGLPKIASVSMAASIVASEQRLLDFCGRLLRTFLFLSLVCLLLLILCGLSSFDAMVYTFTALSTGGILPSRESPDLMLGNDGMIVVSIFLLIASTSIFWHREILRLNFRELTRHRESYFVLALFALLALFIAYELALASGARLLLSDGSRFAEGMLNAASLVSTSAIQSRPGVFSLLPSTLVLLVIFVGAGCYSTSGGLKMFRIGGMFSLSRLELDRLIYPHLIGSNSYGSMRFTPDDLKAIWSLFAAFIMLAALGTCVMAFSGLPFQAAFYATFAAISNAGPLYTPDAAPAGQVWPGYVDLTSLQRSALMVIMMLGRLEIIAIIACITTIIRRIRV